MKEYHALENWLAWIDELSENDYVIVDQFIRDDIFAELRNSFLSQLPEFTEAGIGALHENVIREDIRSDQTFWLDRKRDTHLSDFWQLIDETMHVLNRYCYLSLSGYEFHFANYPPGSKYKKHLDQFNHRNNRMITVIIYLNQAWQKGDGGELEIFLKSGETKIIEPLQARCVLFKSADLPHQVLLTHKNRYSLTGWLLYQPGKLGQLLG